MNPEERENIARIPCSWLENQLVVSNSKNHSLHLLNESGSLIWNGIKNGDEINVITNELSSKFNIKKNLAAIDIENFIQFCRDSAFTQTIQSDKNVSWGNYSNNNESNCEHFLSVDFDNQLIKHYLIATRVISINYSSLAIFDLVNPLISHLQLNNKDTINKEISASKLSGTAKLSIKQHQQTYSITTSHSREVRCHSIDELIENLQIKLIELAYRQGDWMSILHSSALVHKNGKVIVMIGKRGIGKSTLTYKLQQNRWNFLADDIVPIDCHGRIYAIPMCQRFKSGSWRLLDEQHSSKNINIYSKNDGRKIKYLPPISGNLKIWNKPWIVEAIIFPLYQQDIAEPKLYKLTLIDSFVRLCASGSVFGGAIDQKQLDAVIAWLANKPCYHFTYSEWTSSISDTFVEL